MTQRGQNVARAAILTQTLFAAGTFLVVKHVLGTPARPGPLNGLELLTLRFTLAGAMLLVLFALSRAALSAARTHFREFALLGFVAVPVNVGLFFEGASRAPAAHAALSYALTPVFVFLLEAFARRTIVTLQKCAGLALALSGAMLVLLSKGSLSGPEPVGDLMLLCAAFSWAIYTVRSRVLVATLGSHAVLVVSLLFGSIFWLPVGVPMAWNIHYENLDEGHWACIVYTALITTLLNYKLWLFGLKRLEATQVAIFNNLQPAATVALAWILWRDPIPVSVFGATGLILGGVSLVQFRLPRSTPAPSK